MKELNCGQMPNTDFKYEEFEGLLASYYITFLPLKGRTGKNGKNFKTLEAILNGFAKRHLVQKPADAAAHPRKTRHAWGQPANLGTCFSAIDMLSSFWKDFGIGDDSRTVDGKEQRKLGRLIIGILHRHRVLTAEFQKVGRNALAIGIIKWNKKKRFSPLLSVIQ